MLMNGPTSTSWARMQRSLWPSQSAAAPKTVGHSRKASTCHVEIPKQLCRLALIILPSLILTTAALADEDEKAYPGAGCQPLNSADPVQRDIDGKMFNVGKEIQTWICPVVKDISSGSHSPEFARITVIG